MQTYLESIALRLHGCPAQHFNKVVLPAIDNLTFKQDNKLDGHSVASGAAYLVETDRFDSPDSAEARYKRGAPKASFEGTCLCPMWALVSAPPFLSSEKIGIEWNSVASGAAYLIETDRFDLRDGAEARYQRGVLKASFEGTCLCPIRALVGAPPFYFPRILTNAGHHASLPSKRIALRLHGCPAQHLKPERKLKGKGGIKD